VRLSSVVEHLPYRTLLDPRLLVEGDRFLYDEKTWTVVEMDEDRLYTVGDPRMHLYSVDSSNVRASALLEERCFHVPMNMIGRNNNCIPFAGSPNKWGLSAALPRLRG